MMTIRDVGDNNTKLNCPGACTRTGNIQRKIYKIIPDDLCRTVLLHHSLAITIFRLSRCCLRHVQTSFSGVAERTDGNPPDASGELQEIADVSSMFSQRRVQRA